MGGAGTDQDGGYPPFLKVMCIRGGNEELKFSGFAVDLLKGSLNDPRKIRFYMHDLGFERNGNGQANGEVGILALVLFNAPF